MEEENRIGFSSLLFTPSQVMTICISFLFCVIGTYGLLVQNAREAIPQPYIPYQTSYVVVSQTEFRDISETISNLADKIRADQVIHNTFLLEAEYNFWHQISELTVNNETTWAFDTFLEYDGDYNASSYYCVLDNPSTLRCAPLILD